MANPYTNDHGSMDPFAETLERPARQTWGPPAQQAAAVTTVPVMDVAGPKPPPANPFFDPTPQQAAGPQPTFVPQQPVAPANPNAGYQPPPPPGAQQPAPSDGLPPPRELQTAKFWTVEFYQQFFDVDTSDIGGRILASLMPYRPPDFLRNRRWHFRAAGENPRVPTLEPEIVEGVPDMYGPFWICTTLWMCLAIVGNLMSKIAHTRAEANSATKTPWSYDFTQAVVACGTIYFYCFGMSSIMWGVMKWKEVPVTLLDALCLYGYSMFIFVLASIACAVPYSIAQWIVCTVAGIYSTAFLLINFWYLWKQSLNRCWFLAIVLAVIISHMVLTMSFKFYFFNYSGI